MRKILVTTLLLCSAAIIAITSCKKSTDPTYTPQGLSLNQLFAGLRSTPQSINVIAGRDTVIYGAKGTMLHFYHNSFVYSNGTLITSGTINLQLTEIYSIGDMIANRAPTMASGQILQSAGEINIVATFNGTPVYTNGYGVGFKHSTPSNASMALFYGSTSNSDSITNWAQSDTTKTGNVANGTRFDSLISYSSGHLFYYDSCKTFTWVNCDCFHRNDSIETSVTIVLPDGTFNQSNTQILLVLPNVNRYAEPDTFNCVMSTLGAWGSSNYNAGTNTMQILSEGKTSIVPAGLNYKLVVLTKKNNNYYYWETSGVVPHNGVNATAAMTTMSENDVKAKLAAL